MKINNIKQVMQIRKKKKLVHKINLLKEKKYQTIKFRKKDKLWITFIKEDLIKNIYSSYENMSNKVYGYSIRYTNII